MRKPTPEEQALWPAPNFENPEQLQAPVIGATVTTFLLAVLFLTTRIVGKRLLQQTIEADDYLVLAAMTVAIPTSIFPLVCLNLGLGLHVWDQKAEWHELYAKLGFASDILFPAACALTKISQCMSYLRLFSGRSNEVFCHIMILFVTTYTIACTFVSLLECRPIRAHWSPETGLECMNMRATLAVIAALNSFSDLIIYLGPIKQLLVLQMPPKQRCGLTLLLAINLLPCTAGLLRLYYVEAFYDDVDELWNASIVWALMMVEMNLGVVCSCLFSVQPVLAIIFPRLFARSYSSENRSKTHVRRQESAQPESCQVYPLSNLAGKSRDKGEADTFEALWTPEGTGSNFVSATSTGKKRDAQLAPGVITVDKEFTVQEEITPCQSPSSEDGGKLRFFVDVGSEDWTLDEVCLKE